MYEHPLPFRETIMICCMHKKTPLFIVYAANNCGIPFPPMNGSIASYSGTMPRSTVTFMCDRFFVPTVIMVGVCTNELVWNPSPENHTCSVDGIIMIIINS